MNTLRTLADKVRLYCRVYARYVYIRLPVSEYFRFRLKVFFFGLFKPLFNGAASYQFLSEQLCISKNDVGYYDADLKVSSLPTARRMLLLDACTPTPDRDSGSIDVFNSIRIFIELGFEVTFIPESNMLSFGRYTKELQSMGVRCLHAPEVKSVRRWLQRHGRSFEVVMLFRAPTAIRHVQTIREFCPQAKLIFSTLDLQFLREGRQSGVDVSNISNALNCINRAEIDCISRVDRAIVISEAERSFINHILPETLIDVVPLIRDEPTVQGIQASHRSGLAFVGNFQHPPNLDAVMWFLDSVWPKVHAEIPEAKFYIVGSYMPQQLSECNHENVVPLGYLASLDQLFGNLRLSVAPLRFGAGLKGKVATSLAYGVPVVITSVGAEGMGLEHERDVLLADFADDFVQCIVRLYHDDNLWQRLSGNGLQRAKESFSMDASRSAYERIFKSLELI